jgi:hypothetical protein
LFDGLLFAAMGWMIALNSLAVTWALWITLRYRPHGPAAWAWSIRLGLLVFLVGSAIGGSMISRMAHTVGAADGGAGLPFLGWSTRYGDLRAAHFLGLHALQALPLGGWLISRKAPHWRAAAQTAAVFLLTALYCGVVAWLYWHALQGLPLIAQP